MSDESDIGRLLRAAGKREDPSSEMVQRVRAATHAEWLASVAARRRQRNRRALLVAASVACATVALWAGRESLRDEGPAIASVSLVDGAIEVRQGSSPFWKILKGSSIHVGDRLRSGPDGRAAITFPDGLSLRLDAGTSLAFSSANSVEVSEGAAYVDSGSTSGSGALQVETPYGVVRHVGTQYEARILDAGLRVRVREGRVELIQGSGSTRPVGVGEQLLVSPSGDVERGVISPTDPAWEWASNAAPAPAIDGRPVGQFLEWVARETGRELVFTSPASEAQANTTLLSGSISGMTPNEALVAVLPATRLTSDLREGRLMISIP